MLIYLDSTFTDSSPFPPEIQTIDTRGTAQIFEITIVCISGLSFTSIHRRLGRGREVFVLSGYGSCRDTAFTASTAMQSLKRKRSGTSEITPAGCCDAIAADRVDEVPALLASAAMPSSKRSRGPDNGARGDEATRVKVHINCGAVRSSQTLQPPRAPWWANAMQRFLDSFTSCSQQGHNAPVKVGIDSTVGFECASLMELCKAKLLYDLAASPKFGALLRGVPLHECQVLVGHSASITPSLQEEEAAAVLNDRATLAEHAATMPHDSSLFLRVLLPPSAVPVPVEPLASECHMIFSIAACDS